MHAIVFPFPHLPGDQPEEVSLGDPRLVAAPRQVSLVVVPLHRGDAMGLSGKGQERRGGKD